MIALNPVLIDILTEAAYAFVMEGSIHLAHALAERLADRALPLLRSADPAEVAVGTHAQTAVENIREEISKNPVPFLVDTMSGEIIYDGLSGAGTLTPAWVWGPSEEVPINGISLEVPRLIIRSSRSLTTGRAPWVRDATIATPFAWVDDHIVEPWIPLLPRTVRTRLTLMPRSGTHLFRTELEANYQTMIQSIANTVSQAPEE